MVSTGRYDGHAGFVPGRWHTAVELEAEEAQPCMTSWPWWAYKSLRSERKRDTLVRSRGRDVQRATSSTNWAMALLKASLSSQNGQWLERGNIWRRAPGICWTMYWATLGL